MKRTTSRCSSRHLLRRIDRILLSLGAILPGLLPPILLLLLILPLARLQAAQLQEARVSQIVRDVKLLPQNAAPRPAKVSDEVRNGTAVRTGEESRTELTFSDATLARLGANTIFTFDQGTRNLELSGGAMLLRVPKNAGGAMIHTAAVSAAITGTTVMLEYHPNAFIKFIVLEGTGRIFRKDHVGESVLVHAGQMLIVNPKATNLPDPVDVDLKRLMETSQLIIGFDGLASSDLIAREIALQFDQKSKGDLVDTNLVIFGGGTIVSQLDPTHSDIVSQANSNLERQPTPPPPPPTPPPNTPTPPPNTPTPPPNTPTPPPNTPTPTPSKSGTPSVIASSTPYQIGSGTTIQTDPAITTNGVTNYGTIYRGPAIDGPASAFVFGSTSAFDTESGFDASIDTSGAAFKFTSLQLTGNPTISTTGGEINLGLIGVDGITSGGPGGTLTFAGIEGLLLATQNGSITLGSEISFAGLKNLTFYARGAGSNLTLGCAISTLEELNLYSEGAVNLSGDMSTVSFLSYSGGDFNLNGGSIAAETISITSGGNVNFGLSDLSLRLVFNTTDFALQATGSIAVGDSLLEVTQSNNGQSDGLNASLVAGGDITLGNGLSIVNDNSGGRNLTTGGNITLNAGGDLTINGDGALYLTIANNDGGNIATGGNISVTAGGDLTASSVLAFINNDKGGSIVSGGDITFTIGGVLTTTGDASFTIVGSSLTTPGATISVSADSFDVGGSLIANISDGGNFFNLENVTITATNGITVGDQLLVQGNVTAGGNVSAVNAIEIGGDLSLTTDATGVANGADLSVSSGGDTTIGGAFNINIFSTSGTIGSGGNISVNTGGQLTVGDVSFTLDYNVPGVSVTQGANITLTAGGDLNAASLLLQIDNSTGGDIGTGGNIFVSTGGDLVTTAGDATFTIQNTNGSITSGGNVTLAVDGSISVAQGLNLLIENQDGTTNPAGHIGTGGSISVSTGGDLTAGSLLAFVNNRNGGSIDSGGNITFNVGGALTTQFDAQTGEGAGESLFLLISNSNFGSGGGTIGSDVILSLNAASISVGGNMFADISTFFGGSIPSASVNINIPGDLFVQGNAADAAAFGVLEGAELAIHNSGSISQDGELVAGGTIASDATINLSANNVSGSLVLDILNDKGGTIGSDATINLNAATISSAATDSGIGAQITNYFGGNIGGSANINFNLTGDLTTQGDASFSIQNVGNSGLFVGGTIGGDAVISVAAANITANYLLAQIANNGGTIGGDATINMNVSGSATVTGSVGDMTFQIFDNDNGYGSGAGSIGSDATINVAATNISSGGVLNTNIFNSGGGKIGGSANINFNLNGNLTTQGDATFLIDNSNGGTIGAEALSTLVANNFTTGTTFQFQILNDGGSIGGDAFLTAGLNGALTIGGDATIQISNGGGFIGQDATIDVNLGSFSANSLLLQIDNTGGTIDGNAAINVGVSGNFNTSGNASFFLTDFGGHIGDGGDVSVSIGGNAIVGGDLGASFELINSTGTINTGANVSMSVGGDLSTGPSTVSIGATSGLSMVNSAGATINTGGNMTLNVGGSLTGPSNGGFSLFLSNDTGGSIGTGGNMILTIAGDIDIGSAQDFSFSPFFQNVEAHIGTGGNISLTVGGNVTTGDFGAFLNDGGGTIDNGGNFTYDIGGDVNAPIRIELNLQTLGDGMIGTGGNITFDVGGDVTTDTASFTIDNGLSGFGVGTIGDGGNITLNITGNVNANFLSADIFNQGGTIGSDTAINMTAANMTANLTANIDNTGGTIGGAATFDLNLTGDLTSAGDDVVQILNEGGTIGGDGAVTLTAGSVTANSLLAQIDNSFGGTVGSDATISVATTGDLVTTTGDATFNILNTDGTIDSGANITLTVGGNISTQGQLNLLIGNYDETANPAGHIGTGGNISLTTGGTLTADSMSVAFNNRGGGAVDSGASLIINIGSALTTLHDGLDFLGNTASLSITISSRYDASVGNTAGSFIGGDANLLFQADSASIGGVLNVTISDTGGTIDGNALLSFSATHDLTLQGVDNVDFQGEAAATLEILNDSDVGSPLGGTIHGNATLLLSATNLTVPAGSLLVFIDNRSGGVIDSDATLNLTLAGNLTSLADNTFQILNGQEIGGESGGGDIGGSASINLVVSGDISSGGDASFTIDNSNLGAIGSDATINVNAADISAGGTLFANVYNYSGSNIGGNALIGLTVSGAITTQGDVNLSMDNGFGSGMGTILGNATINVNAASVNAGGSLFANIFNYSGGNIGGSALISLTVSGDIITQGDVNLSMDSGFGSGLGTIGGNATIDVNAASVNAGGSLLAYIFPYNGAQIGENAIINFALSGAITTQSNVDLRMDTGFGTGLGTIGGNATIQVNAASISAGGSLFADIFNYTGGSIVGSALVGLTLSGDIITQGDANFIILNSTGATIGSDATINVNAANITANSLLAQIDNSSGEVIGGNATINMNVSGSATVTGDATVQILGSDGAATSAININGGSYDAGGTFLALTDADGTITFNNASVNADVLKVGALGTNGVLNIGGGTLSADTTLKLYASGSNGQLNFISNVTLGGNSAKILAANSVTIVNGVLVTIGGSTPADVYTGFNGEIPNANYTGFGGNGSTTGTFGGAGANDPQPIENAPPFDGPSAKRAVGDTASANGSPLTPPSTNVTSPSRIDDGPRRIPRGKPAGAGIKVNNTDQLLALLDRAAPGPGGKITIPPSRSTNNSRDSSRMNGADRSKTDRGATNFRTASLLQPRRSP